MKRQPWPPSDCEALRLLYPDYSGAECAAALGRTYRSIIDQARKMGLRKSKEWISDRARQRSLDPNHGGRATQFKPGKAPVNKGIKHPPGWAPGRMAESQFKPGTKPHTWLPIGSYHVKDGYLERKVTDLPGSPSKRWHGVHRIVWEAANGPTPAGHVVVFKPGKQTTDLAAITLDAIELISRTELMRRNTRHNYGPEINELIGLRARITRQINKRTEGATP